MFEEALGIGSERGDRSTLADALFGLGWVAALDGDVASAIHLYEQSLSHSIAANYRLGEARVLNSLGEISDAQQTVAALAIYRDLGDLQGIAWSVIRLGMAARNEANGSQAATLLQEGIALQRRLGDKDAVAWGLSYLADAYQLQQQLVLSQEVLRESLQLFKETGNQLGIAYVHLNTGDNALTCANATDAAQCYNMSLQLFNALGYRYGIALSIAGIAGVAALLLNFSSAARLFGASEQLLTAIHSRLPSDIHIEVERIIADSRLAQGEPAFEAAWAAGQVLTLEQAVAEALVMLEPFDTRLSPNGET
jgi:tetratricopeptide (TPR) repeat protein